MEQTTSETPQQDQHDSTNTQPTDTEPTPQPKTWYPSENCD